MENNQVKNFRNNLLKKVFAKNIFWGADQALVGQELICHKLPSRTWANTGKQIIKNST